MADRLVASPSVRFRHIGPDRRDEFVARGLPARFFFPHRLYLLPRYGPDALKLGLRMAGNIRAQHVEVLLHADESMLDGFPRSLFFDDDIIWHRQHLGLPGHIAYACLMIEERRLYGLNYVSDLVQRISRRRELKTHVEKAFDGWHHLLLNAIISIAAERGCTHVYSPTAAAVIAQTDPTRTVGPALFERIYDRAVEERFEAVRDERWWKIDVAANRGRLVVPTRCETPLPRIKTIGVTHDIELGLGHADVDPHRTKLADAIGPDILCKMLDVEQNAGVVATYNVVGRLLDDVRGPIEEGGHCVAFHSYSHRIRQWWTFSRHYHRLRRAFGMLKDPRDHEDQLYSCRLVDLRMRGFRVPRSRPTAEWSDRRLVYRNFDWCATSQARLESSTPIIHDGLVKIPIHFDDFPLYRDMPFESWRRDALKRLEQSEFVVFGLHDCYGDLWIRHYPALLERVTALGQLRTLDQVADAMFLAHAV